jgi:hypothetical protein
LLWASAQLMHAVGVALARHTHAHAPAHAQQTTNTLYIRIHNVCRSSTSTFELEVCRRTDTVPL